MYNRLFFLDLRSAVFLEADAYNRVFILDLYIGRFLIVWYLQPVVLFWFWILPCSESLMFSRTGFQTLWDVLGDVRVEPHDEKPSHGSA